MFIGVAVVAGVGTGVVVGADVVVGDGVVVGTWVDVVVGTGVGAGVVVGTGVGVGVAVGVTIFSNLLAVVADLVSPWTLGSLGTTNVGQSQGLVCLFECLLPFFSGIGFGN